MASQLDLTDFPSFGIRKGWLDLRRKIISSCGLAKSLTKSESYICTRDKLDKHDAEAYRYRSSHLGAILGHFWLQIVQ
jgi:hypothetical protein